MGTSYVARADRPRSRWLPVGLLIAGLLVVSVAAALAPRLGTLGQGANPVSTERVGYGSGYPLHGGLAGPSDVRAVVQHFGYGFAYPLHGGLAGPSEVRAVVQHFGNGSGYPLHGGLAGPSDVRVVQHFGYGPGYPLHGGLAGPSQVEPAP